MPFEIVEIGPDDHRLWAEAVALFRGVRHDRHHQFLSDPVTVAFVARDGASLVGWAWGYRLLRADGDSMLLLYEIEVVDSERRKGIGRGLVDAFLDLGRSERCQKVWLFTETDNKDAVSLYEETGAHRSNRGHVLYSWELR